MCTDEQVLLATHLDGTRCERVYKLEFLNLSTPADAEQNFIKTIIFSIFHFQ